MALLFGFDFKDKIDEISDLHDSHEVTSYIHFFLSEPIKFNFEAQSKFLNIQRYSAAGLHKPI